MFTAEERKIYGPYWNGQQDNGNPVMVYADPLVVHRALYGQLPDFAALIPQLFPDPKADPKPPPQVFLEAAAQVVPVIASAFSLTIFDPRTGEGYETRSCIDLLEDFLNWCDDQKKTPSKNADSSAPMASALVPQP